MKSKWLGLCVACRKDLYRDPSRHYISRSHLERVAASDRRRERDRLRANWLADQWVPWWIKHG